MVQLRSQQFAKEVIVVVTEIGCNVNLCCPVGLVTACGALDHHQMIKRPAGRNQPDWATKIHIASYLCYYHNYLLGELLASQLNHYLASNVLKSNDFKQSYYGKTEVGAYLKKNIFMPGERYYWNDMIGKATGEKLTAKYYAE